MNINVVQAQEDKYGNVKENIYLAFDEHNQYLGSGYVYPMINRHQTNETPYLIYMNLLVEERPERHTIQQLLFEALLLRAKQLREDRKELTCRIYAGFMWDEEMMTFYKENGFEEDYSIFMEADLTKDMSSGNTEISVEEFTVQKPDEFEAFKKEYDSYFVTPLDEGFIEAQKEDPSFKNFRCFLQGEVVGEFSVRIEDECGWIEILYVNEQKRGQGISKQIMNYIHQYFKKHGLSKSRLEVWELNKRAVKLYR